MMRFEGKGSDGAQGSSTGFKTFDVILLRDNRDKESKAGQSLRCSAFKGAYFSTQKQKWTLWKIGPAM
jgi:hypothetical protein